MNLGYLRRHLREALKEPDETDSFWTNLTLNDWLNEGAKVMASIAQPIETLYQFTTSLQSGSTTQYAREYVMPPDFDEVFGVTLYNGQEQELMQREMVRAAVNSTISGVPSHFYVRRLTRKRVESDEAGVRGSDIDSKKRPRTMLGLDPRPSDAFTVSVFHYSTHFQMRTDSDVPIIPFEYRRGIIDYALYLAMMSDEMFATANLYMNSFNSHASKCRDKMISRGQETDFPLVKIRDDDEEGFFYHVSRSYP